MNSRRKWLLGCAALTSFGAYSYHRTLRFPRLTYEPSPPKTCVKLDYATVQLTDCIPVIGNKLADFRAYGPEPSMQVEMLRGKQTLTINNVSPQAKLAITGEGIREVSEVVDGISRTLSIDSAIQQNFKLQWSLSHLPETQFAVIGDTGGGKELDWCLRRAAELNCDFLLHLGDFNYSEGEYKRAISAFYSAPISVYVAIGNHDFNDSGLIYQPFLDQIGPFNHAFELNGVRFINLDTAADFFPVSGGMRGELLTTLSTTPEFQGQHVVFTHRPLKDPRPDDDHQAGSEQEVAWLADALKQMPDAVLLAGHVHHSAELYFNGIRQITAGEGLGYENLVLQRPTATLLVGNIDRHQQVRFRWEALAMPWNYHTSPTHAEKLKKDGFLTQLAWYQDTMNSI